MNIQNLKYQQVRGGGDCTYRSFVISYLSNSKDDSGLESKIKFILNKYIEARKKLYGEEDGSVIKRYFKYIEHREKACEIAYSKPTWKVDYHDDADTFFNNNFNGIKIDNYKNEFPVSYISKLATIVNLTVDIYHLNKIKEDGGALDAYGGGLDSLETAFELTNNCTDEGLVGLFLPFLNNVRYILGNQNQAQEHAIETLLNIYTKPIVMIKIPKDFTVEFFSRKEANTEEELISITKEKHFSNIGKKINSLGGRRTEIVYLINLVSVGHTNALVHV